jgi:regulator of cell morphogenesis and NO signaling
MQTSYAERRVADIAAALPGATEVFRRHKIDFCCGGQVALADAAAAKGESVADIASELAQLQAAAPVAPKPTDELITHILERYHAEHRRELPELLRLAARVEVRHAEHSSVPRGLHRALEELADALEEHMLKEEQILFPLMRAGGHPMITAPIGRMRHEHDEHGARLENLARLAHDFELPADACTSWCALYAGLRKLIDDVHEHVHLENNVLFARFDA